MTSALTAIGSHLRALGAGTLRAWWSCLGALLVGVSLGWFVNQAMLVLAAWISVDHPWLAVGLTSLGFTGLLVGYLYALRSLGRHLALGDELLTDDEGTSLLQEPLGRLVAVTLLPFLGIYTVFGQMQRTSANLVTNETVLRDSWTNGVLATLNPRTTHQIVVVGCVLAGAWLVRRVLDRLHERTDIRLFGILTAVVEAFFMLVLVFGGWSLTSTVRDWVADRRLSAWLGSARDAMVRALAHLHVELPQWLAQAWEWFSGPVWNTFMTGLGEPLLWLAVTALVFGSQVLSLAELWRATSRHVPARIRRLPTPKVERHGVRRVLAEVQETFLGDIDDRWMPTVHSLRLVLAGGASLLGAFCLLHALAQLPGALVETAADALGGPQDSAFWSPLSSVVELLGTLAAEPLRLSLLAVAYLRCLQLVRARAQGLPMPQNTPADDEDLAEQSDAAKSYPGAKLRPLRRILVGRARGNWQDWVLGSVAVVAAGALSQWYGGWGGAYVDQQVGVGQAVPISSSGQTLELAEYGTGNRVVMDEGGVPMRTSDIFLGIDVRTRTPGEQHVGILNCVLRQGGHDIAPVLGGGPVTPETGYLLDQMVVFERPRGGLVGAQVVCTPLENLRTHAPRVVVDLGITPQVAARLEASTKMMLAEISPAPEVLR